MRNGISTITLLLGLCVHPTPSPADTTELLAVEDSWVYGVSVAQNDNYGSDDPLELAGASGAYKRHCLFKWDLSGLGAITVQSAQIVLTTRAETDWGGDLPAHFVQIDAAWGEMTVTWANQPSTSTVVSDTLILYEAAADPWTQKTWALNASGLALVQDWADGQPNYGLKLAPADPAADSHLHNVRPREAMSAADRPKLIITYLSGCLPPEPVTDLSLLTADATRLELQWTAPSAVVQGQSVGSYELRYSTSVIDAGNFDSATLVPGVPTPASEGTPQTCWAEGLASSTTYYFAMKCHGPCDGLISDLSNVLSADTTPPDVTPPAAPTDLATGSVGTDQLLLAWTATGDDGMAGTADHYDVRYSTSSIDASNFDSSTPISQTLIPNAPGQSETLLVTGLTPDTTYYFALKVYDEADNASDLSNVASARTQALDTIPPAAVSDLAASNPTSASVRLSWTAPGDDGVAGVAAAYDVRYSTATISNANWAGATRATGEPNPQPAGSAEAFTVTGLLPSTQYYFAVKADDDEGNTSALSNIASQTTTAGTPGVGPTLALKAHYESQLDDPDNLVDPWAFAIDTDIHIDYYSYGDYVPEITTMFTRWADSQVKFGLVTGDLGGGPGAVGGVDQPAHLMQVYNGVADVPPFFISIGNHECDGPGKGWWLEGLYPGVVPDLEGEDWGRYRYWSFDYRGFHFICLDQHKCYGGSWYFDYLSPEQWQWLEQDLEANRGKTTFVFFHEPVVDMPGGVPHFFFGEGQKLMEMLWRYPDAKWILHGHLHLNYRLQWEGLSIIEMPRFAHLAMRIVDGQETLCDILPGGSLSPVPTPFTDITGQIDVPRADVTGDVDWIYENPPGSTSQQVAVTASFLDDPYSNSTYTYTWQAPTNPNTGQVMVLVSGGGSSDNWAVYASPEAPSADPIYLIKCTLTGNDYGNSANKAAVVTVHTLGDLDTDGDVDRDDYASFAAAMLGPGVAPGTPEADLDSDGDGDLADFALMTASFSGPL